MRVGRKGLIKGIIPASTIEFCIEMDVRQTADGHLVLLHDETVDRTTEGTGAISEFTLKQVKALDAGMGTRIPTPEDVFSHFARDEVILDLEIESPGIEAEVVNGEAEMRGFIRRGIVRRGYLGQLPLLGERRTWKGFPLGRASSSTPRGPHLRLRGLFTFPER